MHHRRDEPRYPGGGRGEGARLVPEGRRRRAGEPPAGPIC